jgi:hypothetical protein
MDAFRRQKATTAPEKNGAVGTEVDAPGNKSIRRLDADALFRKAAWIDRLRESDEDDGVTEHST